MTWRLRDGLPSLRRKRTLGVIQNAFERGRDRFGFRLVHFAIFADHVHMIAEADDAACLARGLQGLAVRVARRVNRLWRRGGTFFADRYDNRIVRSAQGVRRLLALVLRGATRHGVALETAIDPFSSGRWFDGWSKEVPRLPVERAPPVVRPRTWVLSSGWKRYGLLALHDVPPTAEPLRGA